MNKRKMWAIGVLFILVLSMILGACSSNNENGAGEKGTEKGKDKQKVLVFGRGADSKSLDPITVTEGETFKVTQNVFETLLNFGPQDTKIQPGLAKKHSASADGLTYTFELQEGVKFHDGTDFNAEAVVKNFERWMKGNDDKFPYYGSMFGGFEGDEGHVIDSVKAEGPNKVVIKLKRPQAPFLKNIAMSPFGMASPTAFEKSGDKFSESPVGTGPFKFVEWKRNDSITIAKFDGYWQKGLPKLDKVIFRSIPDNSARLNALVTGEIDLADGINPSDAKTIESNNKLQLIKRPSMNIGYLGMTVTRPPFDNVKVRQAVNYAIDKKSIVDAFFNGGAEVAKNPMPSSISGYNDSIKGYEYNPEKAKELLKEAGYDGKEIELWAMPVPRPYMPDGQKVAQVIKKNLEDVGMKAKIVSFEWATYLDKAKKGEADAFMLGWTGDNGDADNFLYTLLDQDNIGSNNYTFYKNEESHKLLIQAQSEVDEAKRNELYKKVQEILFEDAPWVPLAHSTPLLAAKADLLNFLPHPTGSDKLAEVEFK